MSYPSRLDVQLIGDPKTYDLTSVAEKTRKVQPFIDVDTKAIVSF